MKRFYCFDCLQGRKLTTNTKNVTSHCFRGKNLGEKKHRETREKYNVCKMSVVSFALAVVFIIRLFSTSACRVPKKKHISGKIEKKRFLVLRQSRCRYRILECTIGKNLNNATKNKKFQTFPTISVYFLSTFDQICTSIFWQFFRFLIAVTFCFIDFS